MTNVMCGSYNKSWVIINQCRLKAIGRHKIVFNFNATFIYPTTDISVRYQLFKRESGYKPWLVNVNIDACQFLRRPYDAIGVMIYKFYSEFSNINHTCPIYVSCTLSILNPKVIFILFVFKRAIFLLKTCI